jgi:competence ComEA-like helix-hairpin-helix protein
MMKGFSRTLVAAVLASAVATTWGPAAANDKKPLDINQAAAEELVTLDGIGEVYARRIVEYRQNNGPFESTSELTEVNGIGEKTLQNIQDRIVANPG